MVLCFGLIYGVIFVNDNKGEAYADEDYSIMPLALSSSLDVGTSTAVTGTAQQGGTIYAKRSITYNVADTSGWSIKLSYANGKTALAGNTGSTTISGANNATLANMANNTWGYAWTNNSTADASTSMQYKTMSTYTNPATIESGTTTTGGNKTGTIHFAAKFASNAVPGSYKTDLLVSLIATPPIVTYTLTYDKNTTDTVGSMPSNQSCQAVSGDSCNINIPSTTPTRTGYDFQGWSTSSGTNNTVTNATNTSISMSGNKTVYAVWKSKSTTYSVTYDLVTSSRIDHCGNAFTAPDNFTITTNSESYEYTVRGLWEDAANNMAMQLGNKNYDLVGWSTTRYTVGSGTASYFRGNKITLTYSDPSIILYAVWREHTGGALGVCAEEI